MRYFLDTEFHEDGRIIHPISLALVAEDGRELYMEFRHEHLPLNYFVRAHVVPNLVWDPNDLLMAYGRESRARIEDFIGADQPEIWAYYAAYDWIVFCQMFGPMSKLPKLYPMWCNDLQQEFWRLDCPPSVKQDRPAKAHNALEDAKWAVEFYDRLRRYSMGEHL